MIDEMTGIGQFEVACASFRDADRWECSITRWYDCAEGRFRTTADIWEGLKLVSRRDAYAQLTLENARDLLKVAREGAQ